MSIPKYRDQRQCAYCDCELPLGTLACPQCHSIIHGAELDALARQARVLEAKSEFAQARELWSRSLALLPPDSKQAAWVAERLKSLLSAQVPVQDSASDHAWVRKLGPIGPIAILLAKSKGILVAIFKLKFLLSFFSFVAIYISIFGWRYGAGISICLLIHEMGHFIDIKRRGLHAKMPVFLPGLGAYVQWNSLGVSRRQIAQISLAGPLAGWVGAACCFLLFAHTHDPLWAALARTGAMLNVLNLIPLAILDGGQAVGALGLVERMGLLAAVLAIWLYSGEAIFFLVAAGVLWRLFTKDMPKEDDWGTCVYFVLLLAALALVLHASPALPNGR